MLKLRGPNLRGLLLRRDTRVAHQPWPSWILNLRALGVLLAGGLLPYILLTRHLRLSLAGLLACLRRRLGVARAAAIIILLLGQAEVSR
jgi:hypothetical protein